MIKTFKCRETENLFDRINSRKLPANIQKTALRKLIMMDAAVNLTDLRIPPSNRLEQLKGDLKGKHSLRINDQWRIVFKWQDGNTFEVEIKDYH